MCRIFVAGLRSMSCWTNCLRSSILKASCSPVSSRSSTSPIIRALKSCAARCAVTGRPVPTDWPCPTINTPQRLPTARQSRRRRHQDPPHPLRTRPSAAAVISATARPQLGVRPGPQRRIRLLHPWRVVAVSGVVAEEEGADGTPLSVSAKAWTGTLV